MVGWGEAASAPTMTGETAAGMLGAARYLTPDILNKQPGWSHKIKKPTQIWFELEKCHLSN